VREIAAEVQVHFGDPPADSEQRAAAFVLELVRGGFLALDPAPEIERGG
jgi:hypothetical protein